MTQLGYSMNMDAGYAGQLASTEPHKVNTKAALEPIPFGMALVQSKADGDKCRLPMMGTPSIAASVELVASNSTAGSVKVTSIVDGVRTSVTTALTATVYATSHAVTMAAIATKIQAVDGVLTATVNADDDNVIDVVGDPDTEIELVGFVTTLGSGQPTWADTPATADRFIGVSLHKHSVEMDSNGTAEYPLNGAVNVLRRGAVYVKAEQAVSAGDPAFFRHEDGGTGKPIGGFRKDVDTDKATAASASVFPSAIAEGAIGVLEVNLP